MGTPSALAVCCCAASSAPCPDSVHTPVLAHPRARASAVPVCAAPFVSACSSCSLSVLCPLSTFTKRKKESKQGSKEEADLIRNARWVMPSATKSHFSNFSPHQLPDHLLAQARAEERAHNVGETLRIHAGGDENQTLHSFGPGDCGGNRERTARRVPCNCYAPTSTKQSAQSSTHTCIYRKHILYHKHIYVFVFCNKTTRHFA